MHTIYPVNPNPQPYEWTHEDIIKAASKGTLGEVPREVLKASLTKVYPTPFPQWHQSVVSIALQASNEHQLADVLDAENVQVPQHYSKTILHLYGSAGKINQVKQFVTRNNLMLETEDGTTVVHEIARSGTLDEIKEILEPEMLSKTTRAKFTPVHMLGFFGSFAQLGAHLTYENMSQVATGNQTPLHIAAQHVRHKHWISEVENIIKAHPELLTQQSIKGSVLELMAFGDKDIPTGIPLKDKRMKQEFEDCLGPEWMERNAEMLRAIRETKTQLDESQEAHTDIDMF